MMNGNRTLSLDLLDTSLELASSEALAASSGSSRNKQRSFCEEEVHLLERAAGGLGKDGPEEEGVGEVAHDEDDVPLPADGLDGDRGGLTDHGVEGEGDHGGDGDTLGTCSGVEDLGRDDPRQRTTGGREGEVVQPTSDDDEAPAGALVGV